MERKNNSISPISGMASAGNSKRFFNFLNMKAFRSLIIIIGITTGFVTNAQVLQNINYSYLYDGSTEFSFNLRPVRLSDGWSVFFELRLPDSTTSINTFSIQWDTRNQLSEKTGTPLPAPDGTVTEKTSISGNLKVGLSSSQQIIVARVTNSETKTAWVYYTALLPDYSLNAYLQTADGKVVFDHYVNLNKPVSVRGFADNDALLVSYYSHVFPTAAPAFSEGQTRVSQAIKPDSLFTIYGNQSVTFTKKGLYLIQKDTTTMDGIAFRAEEGYPKFNHLQDLVGPFAYICAKDEYDRLRMGGEDKKKFDKSVLAITRDADRARGLMKNYFNRAETANHMFTSYKEGWRSDRGMILMIYGAPKTVYKFIDREVWEYGKTKFSFAKSATLFDPDNYVLIRNKKYAQEWYEKVDLIRNNFFQ